MMYDRGLKADRMDATRACCASGTFEILDKAGGTLLVYQLTAQGGTVAQSHQTGDETAAWSVALVEPYTAAVAAGEATQAQFRRPDGSIAIRGLSVGTRGQTAAVRLDTTRIVQGQRVALDALTITHA